MTNIRLIFKSEWMVGGVACEILLFIVAVLNWFFGTWPAWIPNAALTVATLGAVLLAVKIARDYEGRGLNEKQREETDETLAKASLSETQTAEVAEAIESSGLTQRQRFDLSGALIAMESASVIEAQKALDVADTYLARQFPDHGHVVVIHRISATQFSYEFVKPPETRGECRREHRREQGGELSCEKIVVALLKGRLGPAYLWRSPISNRLCYTDWNDPERTGALLFSFENCVPRWDGPASGDYWLDRDSSGAYSWIRKY